MKAFAWLVVTAVILGAHDARSCDLQRGNEVYLDARAEVNALSPSDRARIAQEWSELEAEQKSLWALAGEIDEECRRGELSAQIVPYNARVYDWQDRLRKFLKRARTPTDSPSGKPEPQVVQALRSLNLDLDPAPAPAAENKGTSEIEFPGAAAKPKPKTPVPPPPVSPPPPTSNVPPLPAAPLPPAKAEPEGETIAPKALL